MTYARPSAPARAQGPCPPCTRGAYTSLSLGGGGSVEECRPGPGPCIMQLRSAATSDSLLLSWATSYLHLPPDLSQSSSPHSLGCFLPVCDCGRAHQDSFENPSIQSETLCVADLCSRFRSETGESNCSRRVCSFYCAPGR